MIIDSCASAVNVPGQEPRRVWARLDWLKLGPQMQRFVEMARRRITWILQTLTVRKVANLLTAGAGFALKRERMAAWPMAVKIDLSPVCNLHCTCCVHAEANGNPALEQQDFCGKKRMTVGQFRRIVDEIKGRSSVVSLHYLGDPLVHPDLDEMCRIARDAGLNVQYSTNFSFPLSDERIRRIVTSGLTHLRVCVDGLSQRKYELTRVGGRIDRVLSNLRRVCACRDELGQCYPLVEVQYIKYQHNLDELEEARQVFNELNVDQVTTFWGALHNTTELDPRQTVVWGPKKKERIPRCHWPYFAMVIKYNGDVVACCNHRMCEQYKRGGDARVLGNVFETSVREVWNSIQYRQARRLVSDPSAINRDPTLERHFCHGCSLVFDVTEAAKRYHANKHTLDELFVIGENGRPIRRTTMAPSRRRAG